MNHLIVETPVGDTCLSATSQGIVQLQYFASNSQPVDFKPQQDQSAELSDAGKQLTQYFQGSRKTFDISIDWDAMELSSFTENVLRAAAEIGYGEILTYQELAQEVGVPKGARAVGNAMGANPLPIFIPCHRVVRSNGSHGGYTGGVHIKEHLLQLERSCQIT